MTYDLAMVAGSTMIDGDCSSLFLFFLGDSFVCLCVCLPVVTAYRETVALSVSPWPRSQRCRVHLADN